MNTDELTQIATAHQSAIGRNESRLDRVEAILERVAQQQEANSRVMTRIEQQQEVNNQAIAQLTAGILDLRNLVADYIQSRSKTEN